MKFFKILTLLFVFCQAVFSSLDAPPPSISNDISTEELGNPQNLPKIQKNVTLYKKDRRPSTEATIAAIVNGTPISVKDLKNKLKLVLKVPFEKLSSNEKTQVPHQILNILIDELLKIQTTEKVGLNAEEKDIEARSRSNASRTNFD